MSETNGNDDEGKLRVSGSLTKEAEDGNVAESGGGMMEREDDKGRSVADGGESDSNLKLLENAPGQRTR